MAGFKQRLAAARERHPHLNHLLLTHEHYSAVNGNQQAGAVTYFAFLSFFPILALAFFVVGMISRIYPDADENLTKAIESVLPGLVGDGANQISLSDVQTFSGLAGVVGVLGVLYAGLGWVSAFRASLVVIFETPPRDLPTFVKGKVRDLAALAVIGLVLLVTVALAGFVSGFASDILGWVGLGSEFAWVVRVLVLVVGLAANAFLFYTLFNLLAEPPVPASSLRSGAILGAVGFEILKQASGLLLKSTQGQPAFQAFGIALILLVWINYFSRLVLYSASWAYTTPEARAIRLARPTDPVHGPSLPRLEQVEDKRARLRKLTAPFAAGATGMLGLVAFLRKKNDVL
ncbi:YihY/virulence factor BrkB family protein [Nocardioides sp. GXZ039]|uniref:YihY/virulence factor BrkB family protein n=1 Tax=Nocardioides sp. GXZ039 TaxID=3136018 RepID=UPI0030F43029